MPSHGTARSPWKGRHCAGHLLQVSWCGQRCSPSPNNCTEREVRPAGGETAAAEVLKQSKSKAWRSQEELFMWRGNVSCSIIAFELLLNRCFQVDLSWFIWSCSAALLVAISNCSLQLWGKGAWGRNKTREEAGMGGLCSGGSVAVRPLLKHGSSL